MPLKQLSSREVTWLLEQVGIVFKRHGKEDIYEGYHKGKLRVVVVPRNRKRHYCATGKFPRALSAAFSARQG